nr:hypothetical protein B456_011G268600 [Ipomoea trifida]GMC59248.1 cytoplasmic tRNA 2-thiolation protein [Ipomoea batatas]GMC63698.1 cytoplasmic tRNA 2-thiolation protein [Ipomoea batatas]GME01281.1 cytoplasmic tRNA 2-thiolation protein [Ipomoea batatas]GME13569.1 cytoplasmic tRNA 2-thiolation protein [Ipomoea batatas]
MEKEKKSSCVSTYFEMPLHYPKYTMEDYKEMPEWKVDKLLADYGLPSNGDLDYKRAFAMGAFLWPPTSQNKKKKNVSH